MARTRERATSTPSARAPRVAVRVAGNFLRPTNAHSTSDAPTRARRLSLARARPNRIARSYLVRGFDSFDAPARARHRRRRARRTPWTPSPRSRSSTRERPWSWWRCGRDARTRRRSSVSRSSATRDRGRGSIDVDDGDGDASRVASRGVARSTREIPFARNSARSRRRRDDARRRAGHRRRHHPIANGIRDRSIDRAQRDSIVADARANATHRFVDAFTVVNFLPKTADCVRDAMIDRCVERARARCDAPRGRARAGTTRARSDRARMIFIDPSRKPHAQIRGSRRHHSTRSSFYDAIDARRLMAVRSRRVRRARRVRRRATSRRRARRRRPKCATRRTGRRRRRGRDGATDRRDGATRSGSNAP